MKNENILDKGFTLGSRHLKIIAMSLMIVAAMQFKTMLAKRNS